MAKNLFDFGDENLSNSSMKEQRFNNKNIHDESLNNNNNYQKNNSNKGSNNFNGNTYSSSKTKKEDLEEQAKNLYDKYKDYSQSELINEFVSTSKQKLNDGSLSKEKINQTANVLSPYLNEQQKQLLTSLMDKLNG